MDSVDYRQGEKATIICMIGNIALSILKFIAGMLGRSQAMVADALHSASDIVTDIAVLITLRIAKKPIDNEHQYGHGKVESLGSAFVGIILLLASFTIAKDIVRSIIERSFVVPSAIAVVAAIVSIIAKETMYRYTYSVGTKLNSESIKANAWHERTDAFSSIGTLFGITGSMIGNWFNISVLKFLDPVAGLVVAAFIFRLALSILKEAIGRLMDSSPGEESMRRITDTAKKVKGVKSISWAKARYLGQHLFVDMAVMIDGTITVEEGHQIAANVRTEIMQKVREVGEVLVHVDPHIEAKTEGYNES